jgi:amidohydrolase
MNDEGLTPDWVSDEAATVADTVIDVRRELHRRPELAFQEHSTTRLVTERLEELGIGVRPCSVATGAVAVLEGGHPGRTVLLRADLDALPIDEEVALGFASENAGVMHACGHDAHAAMLLGAAEVLARRAEDLPGRFVLVFQPAEEIGEGARHMIDAGAIDGLDIDAAIACHVAAPIPVGLVGMRPGVAMASWRTLTATITGPGTHGSISTKAGNVVLAASHLAGMLPGTVADLHYEGMPCACSTGMIHAGTAPNVVPTRAQLRGTLRTFTPDQADQACQAVREACDRVADEFEVEVKLDLPLTVDRVINDGDVVERVRRGVAAALGGDALMPMPPAPASDDMAEFLDRIPGCYFFLGAGDPGHPSGATHSPTFRIDERCLTIGVTAMASAALELATQAIRS